MPGTIVHFELVAADADRAEEKQPVPTHGWFAPCEETEGNSLGLWQRDPNAA